jgi:hypothetical protein
MQERTKTNRYQIAIGWMKDNVAAATVANLARSPAVQVVAAAFNVGPREVAADVFLARGDGALRATPTDIKIMVAVTSAKLPLTLGELAANVGITKSGLYPPLNRLAAMGFLTMTQHGSAVSVEARQQPLPLSQGSEAPIVPTAPAVRRRQVSSLPIPAAD